MSFLAGLFCVFLMILGVAEAVRRLTFRRQKPLSERFTLVVAPTGTEDCEAAVRAAASRVKWMDMPCRLVCVTEDGGETERICANLCGEYPNLLVCSEKDLTDICLED